MTSKSSLPGICKLPVFIPLKCLFVFFRKYIQIWKNLVSLLLFFARYGIKGKILQLGANHMKDLLRFLLFPVRRYLNTNYGQHGANCSIISKLDLELPKLNTDIIRKIWQKDNKSETRTLVANWSLRDKVFS